MGDFLPAVSGLPLLEIPTRRALEAMPEDELLGRALAVHATAQQAAAERGAVAGLFLCEIKTRCEADGRSFRAWVEEHWPHARSTAYAWIALASQVQQNSVRLSDTSPGLARLAITVERERKGQKSPQVQQDSVRPSDTTRPAGQGVGNGSQGQVLVAGQGDVLHLLQLRHDLARRLALEPHAAAEPGAGLRGGGVRGVAEIGPHVNAEITPRFGLRGRIPDADMLWGGTCQ